MSIVAVAIVLSFHLRKTATEIELRMAKPLGAIFWVLSVSCLGVGVANYLSVSWFSPLLSHLPSSASSQLSTPSQPRNRLTNRASETVNKYSRRAAIVQSGWKTQTVPKHPSSADCSAEFAWDMS